ncbi:ABC transporter permease [Dyadobacter psychrotolerans]|uniref:FtsX-like permease family protein n=1 Tax=Dyadobacter psychrotolerans TaxID=2541721 RepID=A0A4R5E0T8_9BACT|nr:ABC transporter permease [Dyadobacter psychrotolerans]TDE18540.1 FtsX-like permease family protein [Dyadobacter psychrotolerans]
MLKNYLKIALRNLAKHKVYSFINIAGLATGMAVAMLIGLWLYDELSYNRYHENYDRIAQVMQHQTFNGNTGTQNANPYVMAEEIRNSYGENFKYALQSTWTGSHVLTSGDKKFTKMGNYFEPQVTEMLSLKMLKGDRAGLKEPNSILLSESVAKTFFGEADPVGKIMQIDNKQNVRVTGVYEDLPHNSDFRELTFIAPWQLFVNDSQWLKELDTPWGANFTQTFVQIADQADMDQVSAKIKDLKINKVPQEDRKYKPEVFLHPMRKWHLYSEWKNGVISGGRIQFVWLFGIIGGFVLLLACINFMNLSTARSEKRAKEVGIRKAVGSLRKQLVLQFFSESLLVVFFAFVLAILLVHLILPFFNEVAGKEMTILWTSPLFWLFGIGFCLLTGIVAGSYPALYLSSFQPVKVLKGTFRVGRYAAIPRKVLVVLQFTVSVTLIIGTIIVFRQIQFAKNRPIGYDRNGLVAMYMSTPEIHNHFDIVRDELKKMGAVMEIAESGSPTTEIWNTNGGFEWEGKDPAQAVDFPNNEITEGYGKTVGWQFLVGRDFSRDFASDSAAFVINEAAGKFLGLKNSVAVGFTLHWNGKPFKIIGVIKDMVVQSPYEPVRASIFHLSGDMKGVVLMKLNPARSAHESLAKIETIFKKFDPATPFSYEFVDDAYAKKFGDEERIGKLATFFAVLAVFISCLGLFGLASFVAEQRTKEIGIRKVLGASVFNLWRLLSNDFVLLVIISCLISAPIAWYLLDGWLMKYEYRTEISWWIFVLSAAGALVITLLTVSFQSIKAALMDPVRSLKTE